MTNRISLASLAGLLVALSFLPPGAGCTAAAQAAPQTPVTNLPKTAPPSNDTAQSGSPAPKPNPEENAWLAKTSKLYYSSAKAGLTGFDCAVHPEWHKLFASAAKGETVPEDDPRIVLLRTVTITVHARMKGGSTIDWVVAADPGKPLDENSAGLLDGMHQSVEQTLEGFLQFWSPFMEDSVIPDSADGLEITHTPTVHTIHARQNTTELTEVFDQNLLLEQFNVVLSGTSIKFAPSYKPTPQGLMVKGFVAHILPPGAAPDQAQEMKVNIEYQPIGALIIPGRLNMEVVGTGVFDFAFDHCTTNPQAN